MKNFILEMEEYANLHNVPIIEKESIAFIMKYIKANNYVYDWVGIDDKKAEIVTRINDEHSSYFMNPRYTGNIFGILYCRDLGLDFNGNPFSWMEEDLASGKKQNDASVYKPE